MKKNYSINIVLSGLFVSIGLLLPTVFHTFGMGGSIFLPMHIPVLLCGLVCGWQFGLIVGFIVPLLSSIFTGMPPLFPVGVGMMFELATYGLIAGILKKKTKNNIVALVGAMLAGRVVSGIANAVLMGVAGKAFVVTGFLTSAFVTAIPGIIIQIVIIPVIMIALEKSKLLNKVSN